MFFALGLGGFILAVSGDGDLGIVDTFIAGVPAFLIAVGALAAAAAFGLPRLAVMGGVVAVGGLIVVAGDLHPGVAMLVPGVVLVVAGSILFARFRLETRPR
jgi:hypothetical protein